MGSSYSIVRSLTNEGSRARMLPGPWHVNATEYQLAPTEVSKRIAANSSLLKTNLRYH